MARADVVDFGGTGQGILLLHGLMGRATTWWSVSRWLTRYGRVVGLDARNHGRSPHRAGAWSTEVFAADAAEVIREHDLGPAVVIGHSMGGLHALALAATEPELVRAVVVEDMAPDQRGRSSAGWRAHFEGWPLPFTSLAEVREFFGPYGDYFVECVREEADGYRPMTDIDELFAIAEQWAERDYWPLVERVRCPVLAIAPEHSAMPPGQLAELPVRAPGGGRHLVVAGAGHVVHEDAPLEYRGAVEAFLAEVLHR